MKNKVDLDLSLDTGKGFAQTLSSSAELLRGSLPAPAASTVGSFTAEIDAESDSVREHIFNKNVPFYFSYFKQVSFSNIKLND